MCDTAIGLYSTGGRFEHSNVTFHVHKAVYEVSHMMQTFCFEGRFKFIRTQPYKAAHGRKHGPNR
eukprot:53873-Pyramimonas_sp.AAC.1